MKQCPCGSGKQYKNCCQIIHASHNLAQTPAQLMRARFSAYALGLVDFIIATYHPDCHAEQAREQIAEGCQLSWTKLVVKSEEITEEHEGFVHFKAFYIEDRHSYKLEERSRFLKVDDLWFYVDGEFIEE